MAVQRRSARRGRRPRTVPWAERAMLRSLAGPICSFAGIRTSSARGLVAKHKAWSSDIPRVRSWTAQAGALGRSLSALAPAGASHQRRRLRRYRVVMQAYPLVRRYVVGLPGLEPGTSSLIRHIRRDAFKLAEQIWPAHG
jgi:hypothetical protein